MAKGKGNIIALFVAQPASTPLSTPEDISEYTLVGFRKGTAISGSASSVDLTDSQSAAMENTPGIPGASVSGTFNYDFAGDAGQNILRYCKKNGVQCHWLLTPVNADSDTQVAGLLQHRGIGSVEDVSPGFGHESSAEISVTINVSGQYVTETVAT